MKNDCGGVSYVGLYRQANNSLRPSRKGVSMSSDLQEPVKFVGGQATAPLPISQIAIVVHDIDDALEKYHRVLGWGPWNVYEHKPPALHGTYLHGQPAEFTMIGAETHVGPIVVELLQPVDGASIYKEWLEEHGEGLHHIAVMRPSGLRVRDGARGRSGPDSCLPGGLGSRKTGGAASLVRRPVLM